MAKITRIKAKDSTPKEPKDHPKNQPQKSESPEKVSSKAKTTTKKQPLKKTKKTMPKALAIITWPFRMIAKPFIALGRYIKASWHEIRQVRWPNRKATWKMTGAILVYAALIMTIILLLDALFTFIFNNILGSK